MKVAFAMRDASKHIVGGDDDEAQDTNCEAEYGMATTVLLERMEAALLTLPRFTREVFLAHRLDDLSYRDIAARTGVSVRRVEREIAKLAF